MRLIYVFTLLVLFTVPILAQNPLTVAKPEESARMKPLIEELTKAQKALLAKQVQLPEAKAVNDAKAVYDKALEALDKAAEKMPEREAVKAAEAKALDEAYRILAAHNLSSREYKPEIGPKGDLVFAKIAPVKP